MNDLDEESPRPLQGILKIVLRLWKKNRKAYYRYRSTPTTEISKIIQKNSRKILKNLKY